MTDLFQHSTTFYASEKMKAINYACSRDSDDKLGKVVPTVRDKLLKGFIEHTL